MKRREILRGDDVTVGRSGLAGREQYLRAGFPEGFNQNALFASRWVATATV